MRTLIYFAMTLAPLTAAIASKGQIELTGPHDRVLLAVPENWGSYGRVGIAAIAGISLTPKSPAIDDGAKHPTASIRADVEPPGSCSSSDKLVKSRLTEFDQRQVANTEGLLIQGKKIMVIHTRNYLADYYNVCLTLNKDRILFTLTVSSGSDAKFLRQYKKDFVWALEHLSATSKDEAIKR